MDNMITLNEMIDGFEQHETIYDTISNGFKLLMELERCVESDIICIEHINYCCDAYLLAFHAKNKGDLFIKEYPSLKDCWDCLKKLIGELKREEKEIPKEIEDCIETLEVEDFQIEPYNHIYSSSDDFLIWDHFPKYETWKETIDKAFYKMREFQRLLGDRIDVMGDASCEVKFAYAEVTKYGEVEEPTLEEYWKSLNDLVASSDHAKKLKKEIDEISSSLNP